MREYNFVQAVFMSFYSRALYRDVANFWGAGVFLYLFLVLAICWVFAMFSFQPAINAGAHKFSEKYLMQIPDMRIAKGKISTPLDHPYLIINPQNNKNIAVIDTSKKYTSLEQTPPGTQVLFTQQNVFYFDGENNLKTQAIPHVINLHFVASDVKNALENSAKWAWVIIFPVFLFISFIYRVIQALFYAVLGKIFSIMLDVKLTYIKIVKLSIVAMTPAIIMSNVLNWLGLYMPFQWLILFCISMAYLIFALRANRVETRLV